MDISFYYIQKPPLERVLIKILEKVYWGENERAVAVSPLEERINTLTITLWTYKPDSFLPHGNEKDGQPTEQPIWLSNSIENPNAASILILMDKVTPQCLELFKRIIFLIDCSLTDEIEYATELVRKYRTEGQKVTQWQQSAEGSWTAG